MERDLNSRTPYEASGFHDQSDGGLALDVTPTKKEESR